MDIGKINHLEILKEVAFGLYLDGGDEGEILLPKRYVPSSCELGERIEVFVYRDSEDRLIATTETPGLMVGACGYLKVQAVNRIGAFLDWGLPKDLLVPFNEQAETMVEGQSYVVYAYIDDKTRRIAASSKLSRYLNEDGSQFRVGQQVELLIVSRSELGFKAVINGTHLGLIFHREVTRPIAIGQKISGYIKQIRQEDARIDLALDAGRALTRGDLQEKVLSYLKQNDGVCSITDRSPPDLILEQFGASKGNYKKALGALYKLNKILIEKNKITLLPPTSLKQSGGKKSRVENTQGKRKTETKEERSKASTSKGASAKKKPEKSKTVEKDAGPWAKKASKKKETTKSGAVEKPRPDSVHVNKTSKKSPPQKNSPWNKA